MKYIFLYSLIIFSSCAHSDSKKHLNPLKKLIINEPTEQIINYSDKYFSNDKEYLLDLYFLLANDALLMGCLEIAHNGFVFLYENDNRPGHRRLINEKFKLIKKILRVKAMYDNASSFGYDEFNKVFHFRCKELKESLE